MKRIGSRDNTHYKTFLKLSQSSRERRKSGRVLIDGMHLIEAYEKSYGVPDEIVVSDSGANRPENARYLESRAACNRISVLADALFDDLALVDTPSGIMAVVTRPQPASGYDLAADAVLLDGVQDPGNLGSILRSAAAAGFRQILLSVDCAQAWSPKALRAAMGAHFQLDIHENSDLSQFLIAYRGQSAATLPAASTSLYAATLGRPLAWVFGSEGLGIRQQVAEQTALQMRIPMPGASESLNVAAAAAVCLFETVRQRQAADL